jgi:hypothetical protein
MYRGSFERNGMTPRPRSVSISLAPLLLNLKQELMQGRCGRPHPISNLRIVPFPDRKLEAQLVFWLLSCALTLDQCHEGWTFSLFASSSSIYFEQYQRTRTQIAAFG